VEAADEAAAPAERARPEGRQPRVLRLVARQAARRRRRPLAEAAVDEAVEAAGQT
jgi:hypothetical protein